MGVLGLHLPPVAGIAVAAGCDLPKDCPPVSHRALISLTCQISVCGMPHCRLLTVRERLHTQDISQSGMGFHTQHHFPS